MIVHKKINIEHGLKLKQNAEKAEYVSIFVLLKASLYIDKNWFGTNFSFQCNPIRFLNIL